MEKRPGAADAAPRRPRPLGPGTLGRRLVVRVVLLTACVAILLSSITTLVVAQLLTRAVDAQLDAAVSRLGSGPKPVGNRRDLPPAGVDGAGQLIGTVVVRIYPKYVVSGILTEGGPTTVIPLDAVNQLVRTPPNSTPRSLALDGLERYRVIAFLQRNQKIIVGIPLAQTDATLARLIGLEALITLLALAASAIAVRTVVIRSLRPLNRLASTAHAVSTQKLDSGEVDLAIRVPDGDADPRNEVGQVGYALNHMLGNVEGALAARQASETKVRRFVADASHELRNPLAAIRGYAELTRREEAQLSPDTAYAIGRVESEAQRMSRLVDDLLLLARLDAAADSAHDGNAPGALELAEADLTALVIDVVNDARAAGGEHQWSLDLPPEPVEAVVDSNRLHQVVANLLGNARTHTPAGTRVLTRLRADERDVRIDVIDDGPGIDAELQPQVFERFTRADSARARAEGASSTGLGLAIVAAVVEAHGGSVRVESEPGRTQLSIRIPRR